MRVLLFILAFPLSLLAETPRTLVSYSSDNRVQAYLTPGRDKEAGGGYTEFTILDRDGHKLYSDTISMAAESARWTSDDKFLVVPVATNTEGHTKTPWRYDFYIISVEHRQWRWFAGSEQTPFVSPEVWCQAPDTIILVGHTSAHGIDPPDDPVLLRYKVSKLWPTLK